MKKILLSLGTLATVTAPIAAVVSCGDDNKTTTPAPTTGTGTNTGDAAGTDTGTNTGDAAGTDTGTNTGDAAGSNTAGEQTHQAAISSDSLAKIGAGILADGRILNNLLSKDSMDDFVNALISITRTTQKAAHETAVFEDSFVFDHSNTASVTKTAKVIRELLVKLISEIGGGDTVQAILNGVIKESAVVNMLKAEKFTVGFATFIHEIKLIDLLQTSTIGSLLTTDALKGFIAGALPIKSSTADAPAAPVMMMLDAPGGSDSVPKFQQGTSKSLTLSFNLDSAGGMFRAGTVPSPTPAAGSTPSDGSTPAASATETIKKFDLMNDLLPLLEPKEVRAAFSSSDSSGREVIQTNLISFIGALMTELGSHSEIVERFTETTTTDEWGSEVPAAAYGHGLVDRLVEALEALVPKAKNMNGRAVENLLSFSNGTPKSLRNKLLGDTWKTMGNMATSEQYTPATYTQAIVDGFTDIHSSKDVAALHSAIDGKTTVTAAELGFTEFADFARDNTSAVYTVEDYTGKSGDIVVHYTLSGTEVAATGNTGTFTVTPKSSDYILGIGGVINVKAVNTNHGQDYTTSEIELRSRVDNSLVAVKAANETNMEFKTETLPVKPKTTMGGQAVTTMTVAELSHAMDIKKIFGVVNVLLGKVATVTPMIQMATAMLSTGQAGTPPFPSLMVVPNEGTHLYSILTRAQIAQMGGSLTQQAYDVMATQFATVVAGAPEFYAALTEPQRQQIINGFAQSHGNWNPVTSEIHKRETFIHYMEQLRHYGTTVEVDGKRESVADAMQTVIDLVKGFDASVWTQGSTTPAIKASMVFSAADMTKAMHAYKVIIEAANAGQLVLGRISSAQFSA